MTIQPKAGGFRLERKDDAGAGSAVVNAAIAKFHQAVEEFKSSNDKRVAALESKAGSVDVLITEKVDRVNSALDQIKSEINAELAALKRPQFATDEEKTTGAAVSEFKSFIANAPRQVKFTDDAEAAQAMLSYKRAFGSYIRKGIDGLSNDERKELSVGTATEGGFLVMPERVNRVISKIYETTPFRQIASSMSVGTNRVILPIDRGEAGTGGWVGEQSSRVESTTPEVGELEINVHEIYAMPYLTQNMIDDSSIDIEGWLDTKVADKFARTENDTFINGDGVSKPRGILQYPTPVTTADATRAFGTLQYVASGGAGAFAASSPADYLLDLIYALKPGYRQGAVFLGARRTIGGVRKLKDGQGNYLAGARLENGAFVESIFGFGVVEGEDMPVIAANSYSLAFGNFKEGYMIVDRQGLRQLRDPYTTKGKVKVYTTKRVGGAVINSDAIKLMKFAAS